MKQRFVAGLASAAAVVAVSSNASTFWVVNFGPAGTLAPGKFGFAGGTGGLVVLEGYRVL